MPAIRSFGRALVAVVFCGASTFEVVAQTGTNQTASVIELRLASEAAEPGFVRMESAVPNVAAAYVQQGSIVSDNDIEHAQAFVRSYGLVIDLKLTEQGAARLRGATSEHVGRRIAVLVNSEIVATPPISSAQSLPDRRVQIGLELPRGIAEGVAARVTTRWPKRESP